MNQKHTFTRVRCSVAAAMVALLIGLFSPTALATETAPDDPQLVALRTELRQVHASIDSDGLRWLSWFDADLAPLADAVEDVEAQIESVLVVLEGPLTEQDYHRVLMQVSAISESWQAAVRDLPPGTLEAAHRWEIFIHQLEVDIAVAVHEWEQAWAQAAVEWEQAWAEAAVEWERAWAEAAVEWEQAWTDVAVEWEQAWTDAEAEIEAEWERVAAEWEAEWERVATEWQQAWLDAWGN